MCVITRLAIPLIDGRSISHYPIINCSTTNMIINMIHSGTIQTIANSESWNQLGYQPECFTWRLPHDRDLRIETVVVKADALRVATQFFTGGALPSAANARIKGALLRHKGAKMGHGIITPETFMKLFMKHGQQISGDFKETWFPSSLPVN